MSKEPETEGIAFNELVAQVLKVFPNKNDWLKKETTKKAEDHSKLSASYDELCWFLAEADLMVRNLFALKIKKKLTNTQAMPSETNIKYLAEAISAYHNALPDLEWQLAERKVLIELLNK